MQKLMENFKQTVTETESPIARQALRLLEDLDAFPLETIPVAAMRGKFRLIRDKVRQGQIAVIANRAQVRESSSATVMISLDKLRRILFEVAQLGLKTQLERISPIEILKGLRPVPQLAGLQVDFKTLTPNHADTETMDLALDTKTAELAL
jgi:hypothetical protein